MTSPQALFDLSPTEEQSLTSDVLKRFAVDEMSTLARNADEAGEVPEGFLDKTVELGLNYMPVPVSLGGAGEHRSPISNAMNIETLAYGDMGLACAAMSSLSVINCLLDYGTKEQINSATSYLLDDSHRAAALATMEPGLAFDFEKLETTATEQMDGSYILNGTKSMVAFGDSAEVIIVFAARISREGVHSGTHGFVIEGESLKGIQFEREHYMGLRTLPLYSMTLHNKVLPSTAQLREIFNPHTFLNLSKIATAALAVGTCQSVLDYVVPYVNERTAFGEPISHRQSVAFMVADMATELEAMRLMVYRAAAQAERGMDCSRMAFLAHRQAIKYGMKIGTDGVQLLGGHGFTREYPVEMWYRNLRGIASINGLLMA